MPAADELEAFRERARALRQRAETAETPLDRATLEETAKRFETLAAELAVAPRATPGRRSA